MRLIYGQLEPDKPPHMQEGLQQADNAYPSPNGWRPIQAFEAITDALDEEFQGGATFKASDGTVNLLAGTATDLYVYDTATLSWGSALGSLTAGRWYFTKFGDVAIGTHGGAPVAIDLLTGTAAALAGSPPTASYCITVRNFVVLLAADGENNMVRWSGFEDHEEWTNGTNQAGEQPLLDGGEITGGVGGEFGLIFQRSQITRMSPRFDDLVWQFDTISPNIGCLTAGSIAQAGRMTFFYSDRGFMQTDGNDVAPIGNELIDRTFAEAYDASDLELMYATVDPKQSMVVWVMPGRAWGYNWALKQWFTSEQAIKAALSGYTAGVTLEELDALFPDLDEMDVSLDDGRFKGGAPLLLVVNSNDEVGTLTGDNLLASFDPPYKELIPGRTTRISRVRPITDAIDGIVLHFIAKQRLGDAIVTEQFAELEDSGDVGVRVAGRYIRPKVTIAAGTAWSYFQGLDVSMAAAGGRR